MREPAPVEPFVRSHPSRTSAHRQWCGRTHARGTRGSLGLWQRVLGSARFHFSESSPPAGSRALRARGQRGHPIMQAFLDRSRRNRGRAGCGMPEWTHQRRRSNSDSTQIHLYCRAQDSRGRPALLPLPQGISTRPGPTITYGPGAIIERAARRADNMEEFKRVIDEIRYGNNASGTSRRAQREAPPTTPPNDPHTMNWSIPKRPSSSSRQPTSGRRADRPWPIA